MSFTRALGRLRVRVLLGLAPALAPALAAGAVPPVLDRVPADSMAVVAVEDLSRLDENSAQLLAAVEMDAVSTLSQALGAMGLREGLNLRGSAAGVLYPSGVEGGSPELVLIVPVTDYGALTKNLKATRDGAVDRFEYAKAVYFARAIDGGYAVAGANRTLVESFSGAPGQLPGHLAPLGEPGRRIASDADIVMLANVNETRRLLTGVLGTVAPGTQAFGVPIEELGGDPRASVIGRVLGRVEQEGTRGVVGVTGGPLGLRMDLATEFREGTFMRRATEGKANDAEPFAALAQGEYLFLGSMNLAHPGLRAVLDDATEPGAEAAGDHALVQGVLKVAREMDRAIIAVYAPASLFVGMLSKGVVVWEAENPGDGVEAFRSWLGSIHGREIEGATLATSFQPGAQRLGAVDAASWSIGASKGTLGVQTVMLYGSPAGPQGFVGASEERGFLTWSKDAAVFEGAARAGAGEGESLDEDIMLQQVRALLPGPRAIEWYINARPVLMNMASIAQFKADLPELLPPIGAGVVMSGGSLHATLFLPAPTIKSSLEIMERAGGAFGR